MGLLGQILGNTKALEKTADTFDRFIETKEEKSANFVERLKAYEPFKLAQRLLALLVVGTFIFNVLGGMTFLILSYWKGIDASDVSKAIFSANEQQLGTAFKLIVGFYFAGGMAEGIVSKVKRNREAKAAAQGK